MSNQKTRREFLKETALAGVGFWALGGVTPQVSHAASESLHIACIGVGGKGDSDLDDASKVGQIVALCDIDDNTLNHKAALFPQAKKFNDYREMLHQMEKQIDAVTVSTADHTHAHAATMAMKMGKHVYVQKPLTHDVAEARALRELAAAKGLCTQMGNQGTAENKLREAVEVIRAGVIGPVHEVHVWTDRPLRNVWLQAPDITARPKETPPVPKNMHWDLFLGTAPERPYHPCYTPAKWRGWWDFGTGALGDMACHTCNLPYMALKLGFPTSIQAESGPVNPETYPGWARIVFEFPAREGQPPVKFVWYEGKKDGKRVLPPAQVTPGLEKRMARSAAVVVGEKGILYSPSDYGGTYGFIGEHRKDLAEAAKKVPQSLPRNGRGDLGMKQEWVEAIRKGQPSIAMSNFAYAGMLAETILLGNIAIRVGKKLEWDGPNLCITNCPEAAQYIKRQYRKGWELG